VVVAFEEEAFPLDNLVEEDPEKIDVVDASFLEVEESFHAFLEVAESNHVDEVVSYFEIIFK